MTTPARRRLMRDFKVLCPNKSRLLTSASYGGLSKKTSGNGVVPELTVLLNSECKQIHQLVSQHLPSPTTS